MSAFENTPLPPQCGRHKWEPLTQKQEEYNSRASLQVFRWMWSEQYALFDNNLIDHWLSSLQPLWRTAIPISFPEREEMGYDSFSHSMSRS